MAYRPLEDHLKVFDFLHSESETYIHIPIVERFFQGVWITVFHECRRRYLVLSWDKTFAEFLETLAGDSLFGYDGSETWRLPEGCRGQDFEKGIKLGRDALGRIVEITRNKGLEMGHCSSLRIPKLFKYLPILSSTLTRTDGVCKQAIKTKTKCNLAYIGSPHLVLLYRGT